MAKWFYGFLMLILFSTQVFAQKGRGTIIFNDTTQPEICQNYSFTSDSALMANYFAQCISALHQQGFLEARIDSISINPINPIAYGFKGNQYRLVFAKIDSISRLWLADASVNTSRISRKPISPSSFVRVSQQTLNYLETKGYPFARVVFTNTSFNGDTISTEINVNLGPFVKLDTLYIKGNINVSNRFIQSYLGFVKGEPFNSKVIGKYDDKLRGLGFVSIIRPTEVEFIPGKARVYTYISGKPASQFSGLIGFSSGENGASSLRFTGDLNLRLVNVFRQGERNTIQWQALGEGTQRVNISSAWSYVLGSRMGFKSHFKLYRRDSTYININPRIGADFFFSNGSCVGIAFDHRSSSTIAANSSINIADFSTNLYQVSFSSGIKNEDVFPIKTLWGSATLGVGTRSSNESTNESSTIRSSVGEINAIVTTYRPLLYNNFVLHLQVQAEMIKSISSTEKNLNFFDNELYRIGGINTLRGFNQESILANAYGIGTIELQYRLQNVLNLYLFYDHAIVSYNFLSSSKNGWPYGIGFGFQLASLGGVLNLSYGLGKGMGEEMKFRNAKIHVGYIASF